MKRSTILYLGCSLQPWPEEDPLIRSAEGRRFFWDVFFFFYIYLMLCHKLTCRTLVDADRDTVSRCFGKRETDKKLFLTASHYFFFLLKNFPRDKVHNPSAWRETRPGAPPLRAPAKHLERSDPNYLVWLLTLLRMGRWNFPLAGGDCGGGVGLRDHRRGRAECKERGGVGAESIWELTRGPSRAERPTERQVPRWS